MKSHFLVQNIAMVFTLTPSLMSYAATKVDVHLNEQTDLAVTIQDSGVFTVDDYPTNLDTTFDLDLVGSTYGTDLNDATCNTVRTHVRMLKLLPNRREEIIRSLRNDNSIQIDSRLASYLSQSLVRQKVTETARDLGIDTGALIFQNPYIVDELNVTLVWSGDALIEKVGETEQLETSLKDIFTTVSPVGGIVSGRFTGIDLACDLREGSAHIEVTMNGKYMRYFNGTEQVLNKDEALSLYSDLQDWQTQNSALLEKLNPYHKAILIGSKTTGLIAKQEYSGTPTLLQIVRYLFDGNGTLINLDTEQLEQGVNIQIPPQSVTHQGRFQRN